MANQYFETSFGDRIEMVPGTEKKIYPSLDENYKLLSGYRNIAYHMGEPARFDGNIREDVDSFARLMDLLKELGVLNDRVFNNALDIAGAEGVHASLLRGLHAKKVTVADIRDGRDPKLTGKICKQLLTRYRRYQFFDKLIENRILSKIPFSRRDLPRRSPDKHLNRATQQSYYPMLFRRTPKVDQFLMGDWREQLNEQYDFIMNFQSFWLFEPEEAFSIIAKHLEPGGILAIHTPYYWSGRPGGDAGGMLCGEFGFFEQRLTLEDIKRYYAQFKPELEQYVETAYNTTTSVHPTIDMYMEYGLQNNMSMLGHTRLYHRQNYHLISSRHKATIAPATTRRADDAPTIDADEVLQNIHRFRPDIRTVDLLTRAALMVFRKNP